jgi:hypothetical protein
MNHHLEMLASGYAAAAVRFYLLADHDKAAEYARKALLRATDYFFGSWRNKVPTDKKTIDPAWWHDKETWMQLFSLTLMWASVFGDWETVSHLSQYPDQRRGMDTIDATPALRQLYIETAEYVRSGFRVLTETNVCTSKGADVHGTVLLARCLVAVSAEDTAKANAVLGEFFQRHHKRKKSRDVTDTISVDGTFMFNLARHRGLGVDIDPNLEHYLVALRPRPIAPAAQKTPPARD